MVGMGRLGSISVLMPPEPECCVTDRGECEQPGMKGDGTWMPDSLPVTKRNGAEKGTESLACLALPCFALLGSARPGLASPYEPLSKVYIYIYIYIYMFDVCIYRYKVSRACTTLSITTAPL